jgi:phage FluMu protein Com
VYFLAYLIMSDLDAKCEKCETINTITLEYGELKKQE